MDPFLTSTFFDVSSFEHKSLFLREGPVWSILKDIGRYLLSLPLGKIKGKIEPGAFLVNPDKIFIGEGTLVEAGAYLSGPCYIGKNCQIRNGAYIRGDFLAGDKCVIGHTTEVKNTIFLDGAQAGHFAYVGDSILGNRVNLGAGTKCANLRFDKKNILIHFADKKMDSGLRKFGVIMGDDAQTGCNSVTNPGTLMGKGSLLAPCSVGKGVIEKRTLVKIHEPENVYFG